MVDVAAAVLAGNLFTAMFLWGVYQFHKYEHQAPLLAYGCCLMPLALVILSVLSTEPLPPHLDALKPLLSAAHDQ